jgi:hypothetical protein
VRLVFQDATGQFVLDDDGEPVYGVWILTDEDAAEVPERPGMGRLTMRMIAGANLFLSAVAMQAVALFRTDPRVHNFYNEPSLAFLFLSSFLVGGFALFLVISGLAEELRRPPRGGSTQV